VSGIGPKLAITVLSGLATADLVQAIRQGQLERLVKIPGVGKKTGERLILELRDKMQGLGGTEPAEATARPEASALTEVEQDVMSALVNLGCNRPTAETAIKKAKSSGAGAEFEPLFRKALEFVR
jgi:Holliday junction DNA helicase RuvA